MAFLTGVLYILQSILQYKVGIEALLMKNLVVVYLIVVVIEMQCQYLHMS